MNFVLDIQEKEVGVIKPPCLPDPVPGGFPGHKKRARASASKQEFKKATAASQDDAPPPRPTLSSLNQPTLSQPASSRMTEEHRIIDQENNNLLASMSPEQLEEVRRELLQKLDPSVLQTLLKRANIDGNQSLSFPFDEPPTDDPIRSPFPEPGESPSALIDSRETPPAEERQASKPQKAVRVDEDASPLELSAHVLEATSLPPVSSTSSTSATFARNTTHFPSPKTLPDLDPADPDFLETLHQKYFPNLPADPSKLAWMAPLPTPHSTADRESPYYPAQTSLSLSALRFDFRGRLLPPSTSRRLPTTQGLHHHADAPEAAGYTVAELARLARSAVPAQRCVAFQTLGRLLYRLGCGAWGDAQADVARGIWTSVLQNRVLDSLLEAAEVEDGRGHRGSRAYAIEALWLLEKGGWRKKFSGR